MNITFNYKLNLVIFGNLIFFLLTLYLVSLLTNYFKVSEFGSYNLFISICSVGVLFIFSPVFSAYRPFFLEKKNKGVLQIFENQLFYLIVVPTGLFLLISTFFFFLDIEKNIVFNAILMILYAGTTSILNFLDTIALTKQKEKFFYLFTNVNILLRVLMILYFKYTSIYLSLNSLILLFILINIIIMTVQLILFNLIDIYTFRKVNLISLKSCLFEIFEYSKNFFFLGFVGWWRIFYDKFLIKFYLNSNLLGLYTFYFQYSFSPFQILNQILSNWVNSDFWSINHKSKENKNYINRHIVISIYINLIFTSLIIFFPISLIDTIILLVSNNNYTEYSSLVKFIALGGLYFSTSQYLANFLVTKDFIKKYNIINLLSFLLSIIMIFVLIINFQLKAAISLLIINLIITYLYHIFN